MTRLASLEARLSRLEAAEQARPWLPIFSMILVPVKHEDRLTTIYINNVPQARREGESRQAFILRCQELAQRARSKRHVVTLTTPNPAARGRVGEDHGNS